MVVHLTILICCDFFQFLYGFCRLSYAVYMMRYLSPCCAVKDTAHSCCKSCICSAEYLKSMQTAQGFFLMQFNVAVLAVVKLFGLKTCSSTRHIDKSTRLCVFILCVLSKIDEFVQYLFVIGIISLKYNKLDAF